MTALGQAGRMRHTDIDPQLFAENRRRLMRLLPPGSIAVVNANDTLPTNADGTLRLVPNSDLFYLTGVEQEESIFLMFPDADDERHREILFLRETSDLIATWEGRKLTKDLARSVSGVRTVEWLSEFPKIFHRLMCEAEHVWLNSNEHKRAVVVVETREARFVKWVKEHYPLHHYHRLARCMHRLRAVKQPAEIDLIKRACAITGAGFERVCRFVRPGVTEYEVEAELAHEFIRQRGAFAYTPIIASGKNACVLHYLENDQPCEDGDLLLLDVASSYANYNSDLTRTIPVNGRFSKRQRQVYEAVLRVLRSSISQLKPGVRWKDWQEAAEEEMAQECVNLGLIKAKDLATPPEDPIKKAVKKYFMHGLGHPIGLDVHDLGFTTEAFEVGWVMTVEPGLYIREEGIGVRLENNVWISDRGPVDLMADIPIEPDAIEDLMASKS